MMDEIDPITRAYIAGLKHELDEARAEIAELNHRLDIAGEERHARRGQLERLREAKDTFFRNAEAWEAKCNAAWKERDEAKAEIARLTKALQEQKPRIRRVVSQPFDFEDDHALKPDTGEQ